MTTLADELRAAWALIDAPEKWTQGVFARDADGDETYPRLRSAVCRCSLGALDAARASEEAQAVLENAIEYKKSAWHEEPIAAWNDAPERTWGDVRDAFARAIERADVII